MTRHRRGALVAALISSLLATPLLATSPSAAAAASATAGDPDFQRPVVGTCLKYSTKDLAKPSESSPPVSCAAKHTAQVTAVVTLPDRVKINPKPGHQANVYRAVAKTCFDAMDATLGGSGAKRAKTAYTWGYFVPTKDQLAQGARWVRCDLILLGGRRLAPLPTPLLDTHSDADRRCIKVAGSKILTTTCSRSHGFRSTKTVKLHAKKYPSIGALRGAANQHCRKRAGVGWFASWPTATEWAYGHHRYLVCYRQTSG